MGFTSFKRLALHPATRGSAFYGVHFVSLGIVAPFINVHFLQIGLSGRQVGLIAASMPLMRLLAAPLIASYADRVNRRVATLAISCLLSVLFFMSLRFADRFAWLWPLMLLYALARSPLMPLADGLIARMANRWQLNFGGMRLWGSVGFATAAILGGALWQRVGYWPMFIIGGLLLLPVAGLGFTLSETKVTPGKIRPATRELFQDRGFVVLLLASFLVGIGLGFGINFEGIFMDSLGADGLSIGLLWGVAAYSEIPIMQFSDRIRRWLGGPRTLLLAYAAFGIAFTGYALSTAVWVPFIFAISRGIGFGLYLTTTIRVADERVPAIWSSTAQSLVTASMSGLSMLVASIAGGIILDFWGVRAIFIVGTGSILAAMILLEVARRQAYFKAVEHDG